MHNSYFKTRKAEGTIPAFSIVKRGSVDGTVVLATAATDKIVGVTDTIASVAGDEVDVALAGQHSVKLGGTVAEEDPLTTDSNGNAVVSSPGSGVNNRIIGFAMAAGVSGDVISFYAAPGFHRG